MLDEQQVPLGFSEGINCCMQVLGELGPQLGLDKETAYRLGAAFGGGLDQGGPCGAVSGALMALGLACGNCEPGDLASKARFMELKREFEERFQERFAGLSCPEVLGCDKRTQEGRLKIAQEGLTWKICAPAVCAAAEIVAEMLELD